MAPLPAQGKHCSRFNPLPDGSAESVVGGLGRRHGATEDVAVLQRRLVGGDYGGGVSAAYVAKPPTPEAER